MIRVCSGFSPSGRYQYGQRFLAAFDKYWPPDVQLAVWVEEPMCMPRGAWRDLWSIPGASDFHNRHLENRAAQGRVPQPCWKQKERQRGYSFRTDAFKFWKQILIPQAASLDMENGDILVWLDGDVETINYVPPDLVERMLGGQDIAYLGRARGHSEIGFWAIRLSPDARDFLAAIAEVYTTDQVFDLPEWHSAYVWDHVRRASSLAGRNICRPDAVGHVWPSTPLARYTRHDKGERKPK